MKLSNAMQTFIRHWGEMGSRWSVNRSVSQIHALLYLAPQPMTAERIAAIRNEFDINIENTYLILNRLTSDTIPEALQRRIDALDMPLLGTVPANDDLMEFEFSGRPLVELGDESPVYQAIAGMLKTIL